MTSATPDPSQTAPPDPDEPCLSAPATRASRPRQMPSQAKLPAPTHRLRSPRPRSTTPPNATAATARNGQHAPTPSPRNPPPGKRPEPPTRRRRSRSVTRVRGSYHAHDERCRSITNKAARICTGTRIAHTTPSMGQRRATCSADEQVQAWRCGRPTCEQRCRGRREANPPALSIAVSLPKQLLKGRSLRFEYVRAASRGGCPFGPATPVSRWGVALAARVFRFDSASSRLWPMPDRRALDHSGVGVGIPCSAPSSPANMAGASATRDADRYGFCAPAPPRAATVRASIARPDADDGAGCSTGVAAPVPCRITGTVTRCGGVAVWFAIAGPLPQFVASYVSRGHAYCASARALRCRGSGGVRRRGAW
jgi:hypothetical protein